MKDSTLQIICRNFEMFTIMIIDKLTSKEASFFVINCESNLKFQNIF